MTEGRWVGQDVDRVDGVEKVTGSARYTADLKFPRLLHAHVIRSPHPHARVLAVRLERAARAPGVRAVASGRDFPFHTGIYLKDQTVFATDRVRYVGDPVAAIAAESEEAALAAAALVEIDYEPLPPVYDVLAGIAPDAPLIHPDLGKLRVRAVDHAEARDQHLQPPQGAQGRLRGGARLLPPCVRQHLRGAAGAACADRTARLGGVRRSRRQGRWSTRRPRARSLSAICCAPASRCRTATSRSSCRRWAAASAARPASTSSRSPSRWR